MLTVIGFKAARQIPDQRGRVTTTLLDGGNLNAALGLVGGDYLAISGGS
jgi:hypothetical protein